jgi:flavin reductase (DIM6/NTAB) family NADH-FMN oxidoreductase RutF
MEIDTSSLASREAYALLIASIVPRPVAWVSTQDRAGNRNLAPFSFFMGVGSSPPMLAVSIGTRKGSAKDTARNIREVGDFVVNICTRDLAERMVATSAEVGPDVDEFVLAGLTACPSVRVSSPGVAESPVRMECRLQQVVEPAGRTLDLVIGEIVHVHLDDGILTDGLPDPSKWQPIARLGGPLYASLGEIFSIPRPSSGG